MARRAAIAMSGGVDSSVAAYLLQQEGWEVLGLFMFAGIEQAKAHAEDARAVAAQLDIPFHIFDVSEKFEQVIDYFCNEYCRGRTPNPCVVCNRQLKFGYLLEKGKELGAQSFATGHYARVDRDGQRFRLLRGVDREKDQSYFLFGLTQDQLSHALFPNGVKTKKDVRDIARSINLRIKEKAESQEICFVPDDEYRQLLRERRPDAIRKGLLKDSSGVVLGEHEGFQFVTIGQRRRLGIAVGEPRYVVRIDPEKNEVIVGKRRDLLKSSLVASDVNWVSILPPETEMRASVQIRYAHKAAQATLRPLPGNRIEAAFDEPQSAITPGQAAVFYDGDLLMGGGWIE